MPASLAPVLEGAAELHRTGVWVRSGVIEAPLVDELRIAVDGALERERPRFPPGDEQHGRVLFAPSYGGPFIHLLEHASLFDIFDHVLGPSILYTMTTSVLLPGEAGPISEHHRDLDHGRPDGIALAALVMVDPFREDNGATEFALGSHRAKRGPEALPRLLATGEPGDVCYFDPKILHRSRPNRSLAPRRAVLLLMVQPWVKQRFQVDAMLGSAAGSLGAVAHRRLGLDALPPGSIDEFIARRDERPW